MTHPGVPSSPGSPLLDHAAQSAIHAARSRLDVLTRQQFPLPARQLSDEEKAEALKEAADSTCLLCGGLHPAPDTPACPRVATFELNGDGKIVKGSFWPDGITESVIETDPAGKVRSVVFRRQGQWDTSRVIFASDLAEEEEDGQTDEGKRDGSA